MGAVDAAYALLTTLMSIGRGDREGKYRGSNSKRGQAKRGARAKRDEANRLRHDSIPIACCHKQHGDAGPKWFASTAERNAHRAEAHRGA